MVEAAEAGRDVAVQVVPVDREDMAGEGANASQQGPEATMARALHATMGVGVFMVTLLPVKVAGRSYSSSRLFCEKINMETTAERAGPAQRAKAFCTSSRHFFQLFL